MRPLENRKSACDFHRLRFSYSAEVIMTRGTERLEAFSDGVFGIALTLLVLEFHIPDPTPFTNNGILLRELQRGQNYSFGRSPCFQVCFSFAFRYVLLPLNGQYYRLTALAPLAPLMAGNRVGIRGNNYADCRLGAKGRYTANRSPPIAVKASGFGSGTAPGENEISSIVQLFNPPSNAENVSSSLWPAHAEMLAPYSV